MNDPIPDRTLVIGLGNPILGDDGVGWRVVQEVESRLTEKGSTKSPQLEFEYLSLGGLSLMERMVGYRDVLVVDSIVAGQNPMGTIYSLPLRGLPNFSSGHTTAVHDTSLQTALDVGRKLDLKLPEDVWVVAVEAQNVYDFSEDLSPPIKAAVNPAAELIVGMLEKGVREEKIITPADY
jgi:hydrogenase maturation protease